ncbi:MAG: cellulase family glycosylhydrolase [Solirubrobacteraceae bacterium]
MSVTNRCAAPYWRMLVSVTAAVVVLVGCGAQPKRYGPPVQVGVNTDITWGIPSRAQRHEVRLIAQTHVGWIRSTVDLSQAEYDGPGKLNRAYLTTIDSPIAIARRAGLNVLLEFDRTPWWATADPGLRRAGSRWIWRRYWRYRDPEIYARIVTDLVRHYRRLGVTTYELWNEPNYPRFWPSGPSAAQYTALLRAAYPAVKRVDRRATVVMGGLSNLGSYAYLQGLYNSGVRGLFDVANFHVYPSGDPHDCLFVDGKPYVGNLCLLSGLRAVMTRNRDQTPAWITELGFSSCRGGIACVGPSDQGRYLRSAYEILNGPDYGWVRNVFVYEFHGRGSATGWAGNLALTTQNFQVKPAYYALAQVTRQLGGGR